MIQFLIYHNGHVLMDATPFINGGYFDSVDTGYFQLTLTLVIGRGLASRFVNDLAVYRLVATDQYGMTIWEGRVEDAEIVEGGIELRAVGDMAAFGDVIVQQMAGRNSAEMTRALITIINTVNVGAISMNDALIAAGVLVDDDFEDVYCAEILAKLPGTYRVWEGRGVQSADNHLIWEIDGRGVKFGRNLTAHFNAAYTVYQSADGDTIRTAIARDAIGVQRLGIERQIAISSRTTNAVDAQLLRDAAIASVPSPSVTVTIDKLMVAGGLVVPAYLLRAGDRLRVISADLPMLTVEEVSISVDGTVDASVAIATLEKFIVAAN